MFLFVIFSRALQWKLVQRSIEDVAACVCVKGQKIRLFDKLIYCSVSEHEVVFSHSKLLKSKKNSSDFTALDCEEDDDGDAISS